MIHICSVVLGCCDLQGWFLLQEVQKWNSKAAAVQGRSVDGKVVMLG